MELTLKQVSEIFMVSETNVIKWIKKDNLPVELVAEQYRFHRADLLEWAAINNRVFSASAYAVESGSSNLARTPLTDAIRAGGILSDVAGSDPGGVLRNAMADLPIPKIIGQEQLIQLFLARESVGSTAIGGGVAIPHPRQPVLLRVPGALIRLCYLSDPLEIPTPDGQPVNKLFLMICPTAHQHLQLLAHLCTVLQSGDVLQALDNRLSGQSFFEVLQAAEEKIGQAKSPKVEHHDSV